MHVDVIDLWLLFNVLKLLSDEYLLAVQINFSINYLQLLITAFDIHQTWKCIKFDGPSDLIKNPSTRVSETNYPGNAVM